MHCRCKLSSRFIDGSQYICYILTMDNSALEPGGVLSNVKMPYRNKCSYSDIIPKLSDTIIITIEK